MNQCKYNICLIDDDRIYQFTAKKIIESTGLAQDVLSFYNGEDALNYLKDNLQLVNSIPDIIFLDINMPVMDGWQFLKAYKELGAISDKKTTIYMVSSSVDEYDIKKSKEYETITDYIIKPINKERFEQLILTASKN